jgi:hypothetical protein
VGGRRGRDRMVLGFTTTYAISAYHHWCCEFESHSWRVVLDTTLCDKVCLWLATGRWFSPGTAVSSTNITDRHDIFINTTRFFFFQWLTAGRWFYPSAPVSFNNIVLVLTANFNTISDISWRSVILVEETAVPGENHRPVASHWQTLSHNVVSSTPRHEKDLNSQLKWW